MTAIAQEEEPFVSVRNCGDAAPPQHHYRREMAPTIVGTLNVVPAHQQNFKEDINIQIGNTTNITMVECVTGQENVNATRFESKKLEEIIKQIMKPNILSHQDRKTNPEIIFKQPSESPSSFLEGKKGLKHWFNWVIVLVSLSVLVSIMLVVVAAFKGNFENTESLWWYMIGGSVCLSCINLVFNVVFFVNCFQEAFRSSRATPTLHANISDGPRIMVRWKWGAHPPMTGIPVNELPIRRVVITHTASEEFRSTPVCCDYVRQVQSIHMESRGWSDIGYNFLVGGEGSVFEGRGWEQVGSHTKGHNSGTLGVAFIGTFTDKVPSEVQLEALRKLLKIGVRLGYLAEDYKIVAHCQLQVTLSPGRRLVEELRTWARFDSSLPIEFGTPHPVEL